MTNKAQKLSTAVNTATLYPSSRIKFREMSTEHGIEISPAKARDLIKLNIENNRRVTKTHVKNLSSAMKAGTWMETGEPVIIDKFGRIIDGQHRLFAVIDSGVTIKTTITYGVDPAAFDVMGTGKVRNLSDVMSIHGIDNAREVTAAYRIYMDLMTTTTTNFVAFGRRTAAKIKADRPGVVAWCEEHNKGIQEIMEITQSRDARRLLKPGAVFNGFFMYLYFEVGAKKMAKEFFATLVDGTEFELGKQDPIYQLRKRIMEDHAKNARRAGTRVPLFETMAILIKAYNAWMNRQAVKSLRFSQNERWPETVSRKSRK